MDFGLGDALKMFESYFGRKWSKALLCVIGIAIAAFCIHSIYLHMCLPVYRAIQYVLKDQALYGLVQEQIIALALTGILSFLIIHVLWRIISAAYVRRIKAVSEETKKLIKWSYKAHEKISDDAKREVDILITTAHKLLKIAEAVEKRSKALDEQKKD